MDVLGKTMLRSCLTVRSLVNGTGERMRGAAA